jgi:hypothetical protein
MKNKSIKIIAVTTSFLLLVAPMFVFAQITNPLKGSTDIPKFVSMIMDYVVKIGGIIAIFAFIWAGFLFVKAQGNESELTKAKDIFVNTCIGVAVLLGAQLIASIVVGTVNSLK